MMKYHHELHHQRLAVLCQTQGIQPPQLQPPTLTFYHSYALYKPYKTKLITEKISTTLYKQFDIFNNRIISMNSI